METHNPDRWVIIEMKTKEYGTIHKVLGSWSGGYLDGDSWRMSSGLEKVETEGDYYLMYNVSGSIYKCHKRMNGLTIVSSPVFEQLREEVGAKLISVSEFKKEKK